MKFTADHALIVAGVLLLYWTGRRAVSGTVQAVAEGREVSSNWLTDFMARVSGLDAEQARILDDPDYARYVLALE